MFPDEFIKDLKSKVNIKEVIETYTNLYPRSGNYAGQCIVHNEHQPSMMVYPATQTYFCFGCGAGGDVFALLADKEGWSFPEIVEYLADFAGIDPENIPKSEAMIEAHNLRQDIARHNRLYYSQLKKNKEAMQYLASRGITDKDIDTYRLGYVPRDDNPQTGYSIVFGILDDRGRPSGLAHRMLDPEADRKYRNSEDSPIFKKSHQLYGLHMVKRRIQEFGYAVLVEGYFDVIALQKIGLPAVGIMGTHISDQQVDLIRRYTNTVVLFMDGDGAGIKAIAKSIERLRKKNSLVKVIKARDGMDPDDMARYMGESLVEHVNESSYLAGQYLVSEALLRYKSTVNEAAEQVYAELADVLGHITNTAERYSYIEQVSNALNVPIDVIVKELNGRVKKE